MRNSPPGYPNRSLGSPGSTLSGARGDRSPGRVHDYCREGASNSASSRAFNPVLYATVTTMVSMYG